MTCRSDQKGHEYKLLLIDKKNYTLGIPGKKVQFFSKYFLRHQAYNKGSPSACFGYTIPIVSAQIKSVARCFSLV